MPEEISKSAPTKIARIQRRPDSKLLGASNKTLMRMLKAHLPLAGKTLKITRSGHGFETQYTVEEVQHKKHWKKKLLARFWDMGRTALALLGALLKLRDWL